MAPGNNHNHRERCALLECPQDESALYPPHAISGSCLAPWRSRLPRCCTVEVDRQEHVLSMCVCVDRSLSPERWSRGRRAIPHYEGRWVGLRLRWPLARDLMTTPRDEA